MPGTNCFESMVIVIKMLRSQRYMIYLTYTLEKPRDRALSLEAEGILEENRMFKNPWRKDGSIRYVELIKISAAVLFLAMVFSLYLESTLPFSELSASMGFFTMALFIIQLMISNYELKKEIMALMDFDIHGLIDVGFVSLKRVSSYVFSPEEEFYCYGLAPILKYRVMRI